MKKSKVRNENHIVIQGWMVNELNLKGNELIIYSIIYGFSQTDSQKFSGSLQYLADWTNSSKQSVINNLKSLVDKDFIGKEDKIINGVKFCEYYSKKFNRVVKKVEGGSQKTLMGGSQESLPNNIDINNINNNIVNNKENNNQQVDKVSSGSKEEEILKNEFEELWKLYPRKEGKAVAFKSYCKYRKSTKADYITKEDVEKGIQAYNRHIKANNIETKYIKQGSTYFNQRSWEDVYPETKAFEDAPEWFYKDIEINPVSDEVSQEMEDLLSAIR